MAEASSPLFTVTDQVRHQIDPVKGSRFIATVAPTDSEDVARALVAEASAEMSDASHHCTAWRIAEPVIDRCNDDGEPGGSAGRPILAQLIGRDLVNVAVVVTRYFGGTKLGVGGLVRAYGAAAAAALDLADLKPYEPAVIVTITTGYGHVDQIKRALDEVGATADNPTYGKAVVFTVSVPGSSVGRLRERIADATAGRARFEEIS